MNKRVRHGAAGIPLLGVLVFCTASGTTARWGRDGHVMTGLAAASRLPEEMPLAGSIDLSFGNRVPVTIDPIAATAPVAGSAPQPPAPPSSFSSLLFKNQREL